ncbi:MAG: flagellar hook-basal body complex protein FliE [Thermodesulfobacteriota bacterium]|nr:flagellar hook-basal body complex protein FliE [Thermodesulfobacteriota bacterium]
MAIQNVAFKAYQNALQTGKIPGTGKVQVPSKTKDQASPFTDTLKNSIKKVNELQQEKHSMIEEFASGEKQNVHELMITLQKAGLAMRMTSAVRNKVMDAYRELSRMSF